jgi:hypothetical protein
VVFTSIGITQIAPLNSQSNVCHQRSCKTSTSNSKVTTAFTSSLCCTSLWPETTVCKATFNPSTHSRTTQILSRIHGNFQLLCTSHRQHYANRHQLHCIFRLHKHMNDISLCINHFLNYAATHPQAKIRYTASQMHLWLHSDASYLNESKARSKNGGFFYLSNKPKLPIKPNDPPPPLIAPFLVNSRIIDAVMSSVQESETGSGFINAKDAIPTRTTLQEMGHPQGPTPIQFDNKCATRILTDTVVQRRAKAMDMRFYWLCDRVCQQQFHVHWKPGQCNLGDYPTKYHSTKHHIAVHI